MGAFLEISVALLFILQSFSIGCSIMKVQQTTRVQMLTSFQRASNGFDMRGVVESELTTSSTSLDGPLLTNDAAFWVGVGFGEYLKKSTNADGSSHSGPIISVGIGRDSRESGTELTRWLAGGLESVGVAAFDVGLCTTPAMYLSCVTDKEVDVSSESPPWPFSGAISVTASHLPSQWNGFKFFTPSMPSNIGEEGIQAIIDCCADKKLENLTPVAYEFQGPPTSFLPTYSKFLKKTVVDLLSHHWKAAPAESGPAGSCAEYPLKGLKISVNAGNGAGGFLAATLSDLGADTSSSLNLQPDGSFPNHIANPEDKKAIQCTADAVMRGCADIGICLDTDADRVGLVEGGDVLTSGRLLNRNCLIALVSKVALRGSSDSGPVGVIVTDSATSNELSRFIESLGGKHVRYKKGYRYVIEMGRSIEGCVAAVECSGHGAWRDNGWVDDGCYTAVKLVAELALMRLEQSTELRKKAATRVDSIGSEKLCRLSDLLVDLAEPKESVELRFRVTGGPAKMEEVTQRALAAMEAVAVCSHCNVNKEGSGSSYTWEIEKVNHEGLRVNFDFSVVHCEEGGRPMRRTGWCMLRPSLHEPILSMQLESDEKGGVQDAARILFDGCAPSGAGGVSDMRFSLLSDDMDISPLQELAYGKSLLESI
jgi:phosphomannomutase